MEHRAKSFIYQNKTHERKSKEEKNITSIRLILKKNLSTIIIVLDMTHKRIGSQIDVPFFYYPTINIK